MRRAGTVGGVRSGGFPTERAALLTTHFGDVRWVELLIDRARSAFPGFDDDRIFVIDQDRKEASAALLRRRLGPVHVLRYPRSDPHIAATGHDHAHVLDLAIREVESDYLLVFDSDAHPIGPAASSRLERLLHDHDAILAGVSRNDNRSHPCFMLFGPTVDREGIRFDAGQIERGIDTGRLVFDQITAMGLRPMLLRAEPAFGGRWGTFYLDRAIYHHGSGSFGEADDERLQAQAATRRREHAFFRRCVFRGQYELTVVGRITAAALGRAAAANGLAQRVFTRVRRRSSGARCERMR